PRLHTLFCLGPFADEAIRALYPQAKVVSLADPVEIPQTNSLDSQVLLEKHGVLPGRRVFLLFGNITARKGVDQLLESLKELSSESCQQLCILIVGAAKPAEKSRLQAQIDSVHHTQPVQVIAHFEFVPESKVQSYYQLSDFVLAPYQRHIGMSGILLLAAAAQKPVLSSDYGLMGELVRRYQLGISIDSSSPSAIADGITRLLNSDESLYDLNRMKTFVEENSATQFAQTIFQHI
ncbi:MAG: glycosyltransferase family 4 protein, partial [Phormidesmis sp.]